MSRFRRCEIVEHSSPFSLREQISSIFTPKILTISPYFPSPLMEDFDEFNYALHILSPPKSSPVQTALFDFPSPFDSVFDAVTDVVHIETTPFCSSYRRLQQRRPLVASEMYLQRLTERVSDLESKLERLVEAKEKEKLKKVDRQYTWTAEIKDGAERKYKCVAAIKGNGKKVKNGGGERSYKWIAEIKGKDDDKRTYTWKATIGGDIDESSKGGKNNEEIVKKGKKKEEKGSSGTRTVEIEEPFDHGAAIVLRQAFAKRPGAANAKGKKKELSPQDAAAMIQISFREYLIHRSRALRALRELAVAKTKLKEIRVLFHNFSYRNRVASDAAERQKFSEKIIVLLLTVDAIEGADLMVRAAKRSMVDELEAMLDVVDPQPLAKSLSARRRKFDMPSGAIEKEIAEGVAQVVEMLDAEA